MQPERYLSAIAMLAVQHKDRQTAANEGNFLYMVKKKQILLKTITCFAQNSTLNINF